MKRSPTYRTLSSHRSLRVERLEPRWMLTGDLVCDAVEESPRPLETTDVVQTSPVESQLAPPLKTTLETFSPTHGVDVPPVSLPLVQLPAAPIWSTAPRAVTSPLGAPPMGAIAESASEHGLSLPGMGILDTPAAERLDLLSMSFQWRGPRYDRTAQRPTALTGDVDGDGMNELVSFDEGLWWIDSNHNGVKDTHDVQVRLGADGGTPILYDFDGDGRDELGVLRPGTALQFADADGLAETEPMTGVPTISVPAHQLSAQLLDYCLADSTPRMMAQPAAPYVAGDPSHDSRR